MRLSHDSRELIKIRLMNFEIEVLRRNRSELERLQYLAQRSGPPRAKIDEKFGEMATEVLNAKIAEYIAAFRRENLVPTDEELQQISVELRQDARRIWSGCGHNPMPEAVDLYTGLAPAAELKLKLAVREMKIEKRHAEREDQPREPQPHPMPVPAPAASGDVTIEDVDALELKPNIFGIGINLNHVIKRVVRWFRQRHK